MTFTNDDGASVPILRPGIMTTSSSPAMALSASGQLLLQGEDETIPTYPMPAYLKFAPGGVSFASTKPSLSSTTSSNSGDGGGGSDAMETTGGKVASLQQSSTTAESDFYNLTAYSPVSSMAGGGGGGSTSTTPRSTTSASSIGGGRGIFFGSENSNGNTHQTPDHIVYKSKLADDRLLAYIRLFRGTARAQPTDTTTGTVDNDDGPIYLPSLSILANAVFGRLTGTPPSTARAWADAMVLQYSDGDEDRINPLPMTEEDVLSFQHAPMKVTTSGIRNNITPGTVEVTDTSVVTMLKRLLQEGEARQAAAVSAGPGGGTSTCRPRPCGYVFKRGDIAWNCRTCQTDSTCVICDKCFRQSDHDGHEVFFHRTTPGGCCDCGDAEAWKVEGCCPLHRPVMDASDTEMAVEGGDPEEAVRMARRGRQDGIEVLKNEPTVLPPKLAAALGVVVGAAVRCLVSAVDGAGVGADPVQWKLRWTDEAARIWNGASQQEDYHASRNTIAARMAEAAAAGLPPDTRWKTPNDFLIEPETTSFPHNFSLHLRLHNDDVHTFDEVIDALHDPRQARRNQSMDDPQSQSLVSQREAANEMTHHVDADGQVTVKKYESISTAMKGFRRLKSRGLHCAVVSSAQVDMELRARVMSSWLSEISAAHPAAAVIVVHALLQVNGTQDLGGLGVWQEPRSIPVWVAPNETDDAQACRRRFQAFPPHLATSYVTSDEAERLHRMATQLNAPGFAELTGTDTGFYANVPYRLPSDRFRKSPHALWGTLPSMYNDPTPITGKHPLLALLASGQWDAATLSVKNRLTDTVFVVDTDLRKQQEADRITSSIFPHKLPGLVMISGVGMIRDNEITANDPPEPNPMDYRHLLAASSFRAPISPVILLLLLDPYPTKQLRAAIHSLFLSLLTDARFKCRFAAALGIAYRPLSTLFCAGVGTEADTPLGFTVQIFTAGSLVRALGSASANEGLLLPDEDDDVSCGTSSGASIGVFTIPIALTVVRCIHTNLLGATKEVHMILNNMAAGNDDDSHENTQSANESLLPALTYVAGEHPLITLLPAAPDDGFLDSRSTRHKRLPHLLRDLEYVIETPGTAMRLLLPKLYPAYQGAPLAARSDEILTFCTIWSRLLRLAQGMDPQKRKISGGHVEYEQNRWLEAFGLSLNFAGTRDALAESPTNSSSAALAPVSADGSHLIGIKEAMGNILASLLREIKMWLYREGMLETGLPVPPGGAAGTSDLSQIEALQRSTLHVVASQFAAPSDGQSTSPTNVNNLALACATSVKMTEGQLDLIESALKLEGAQREYKTAGFIKDGGAGQSHGGNVSSGAVMGDWLRVPHSPLAGDSLSFHLPLHRALAKTIRSFCSVVVPESIRNSNTRGWWKLPVLDEASEEASQVETNTSGGALQHPLVPLIRPVLRSSNCRVVWSAGPDCTSREAQRRRSRSRTVSANIAVAKIIHSLADHPIRCLAAAQQIERHLWARNGSSVAGMALNYSNAPLCRSFRDLDLTLVQLSAAGMSVGLGARRIFSLLVSRFSMDGYLCDPERRSAGGSSAGGSGPYGGGLGAWINPPRLQDPEHATVLSESLFATLCILVTELPAPPPISSSDETWLRQSIRRELIHALAAEPRSHSAAMSAASVAVGRRDESDGSAATSGGGGLFRDVFSQVLKDVGKQKTQGSRSASGPSSFELDASCCDEYDPTFFHLRRQEHQHAMDVVANLRRQKINKSKDPDAPSDAVCFPLVCQPPKAHPRFLPCRLMLHLAPMDAAVRRALLFALSGGSWLPPSEPLSKQLDDDPESASEPEGTGISMSVSTESASGDVPVMTFSRRAMQSGGGQPAVPRRGASFGDVDPGTPFSSEVVAASSVSFLEVLQLLTLQVHTLEECAALHRTQQDVDEEARLLSASLSINSYLGRLVRVPESLVDVWALRPYPEGPLKSKGSGENRGSILGLLIALYEHRADHGAAPTGSQEETGDDHGGARSITASGLKWLLRFVNALVDGAPSVAAASKSATTGVPMKSSLASNKVDSSGTTVWTIDEKVRITIGGMLANLPDLWPKPAALLEKENSANKEKKERGKAAQQRILEMMKKKQSAFVQSMGEESEASEQDKQASDKEENLCIICRCDDVDGENNGPLCYLAHLQRSRVSQMRACSEAMSKANDNSDSQSNAVFKRFRVVGHMGCQVRETEAMDSRPVYCLPRGSIVSVLRSTISDDYDILSRRVFVRHEATDVGKAVEGWASVQSSQGYVILSPLVSLCYENTRWGSTRPIMRQCGHVAHLKCVETHLLSLHQRAAGDQPYDGRFAANIDDGEFLCPLCKQLSNILLPGDGCARQKIPSGDGTEERLVGLKSTDGSKQSLQDIFQNLMTRGTYIGPKDSELYSEIGRKALSDFGSHLLQAMAVPWERSSGSKKRKHRRWHPSIHRWDYEEENENNGSENFTTVGSVLRLLRQQLIAWASVGHSAAVAEAAVRGIEEVLPFGSFSKTDDPWTGYGDSKEENPMALELSRTMTGAAGLLEVLMFELSVQLNGSHAGLDGTAPCVVGQCLADILCGKSWFLEMNSTHDGDIDMAKRKNLILWSQITALMAAMPSHVSRDGMLSQRHEARAAAAQMWVARGKGTETSLLGEPPVPLAIDAIFRHVKPRPQEIQPNWGSMNPTVPCGSTAGLPFRPAVATGFLYTPLLAWDLVTLSGAVFSSMLLNTSDVLPNSEDILNCARLLIAGRLIQVLVSPHGFDLGDDMEVDEEDEEGRWSPQEIESEGEALSKLYLHCKVRVERGSLDTDSPLLTGRTIVSPTNLFGAVGRAVLPFARAVILMMRACDAAVKSRTKARNKEEGDTPGANDGPSDDSQKILESVLEGTETLTTNDGLFILKEMKGPMPSTMLSVSGDWWALINRWITAVIGLEKHHGSRGKSLIPSITASNQTSDDEKMPASGSFLPTKTGAPHKTGQEGVVDNNGKDQIHDTNVAPDNVFNDDFGSAAQQAVHRSLFNDSVGDESDEELVEDMEMEGAEDMVDFADQVVVMAGGDIESHEESADDPSSSGSEAGDIKQPLDASFVFAGVSKSPIINYQPSILAQQSIGPGKDGSVFEADIASSVMADLSHLGLVHRMDTPTFSLIRLPKSFVELYGIVNKIKGRDESNTLDEADDVGSSETAICLLTGAVMKSGSTRRSFHRTQRPPGACTLHARMNGSGIGIFFLVQKCTVLLMHNNKSAYSASLYVDEHGEEDPGLRRGRPLFLNHARYQALEQLWRQQGIPREVAQIRSTSDRVIRDNWY
jgi:Proteolysis_6 C-terminal/Putative zinc finger in N-recognin (UBR box)